MNIGIRMMADDPPAAARGIAVACLIGAVLWAIIVYVLFNLT
jgi:hypothetical protein